MTRTDAWRCSESRPIPPFRTSGTALRDVGFRYREDNDYSSDDPFQVTLELNDLRDQSFRPSFALRVDAEVLQAETGIPAANLVIAIVVKDPALLTTHTVARWPASGSPPRFDIPDSLLKRTAGNRGYEFAVLVSPSARLPAAFRLASAPGHIVASRRFYVDVPDDGIGFPITTVTSQVFKDLKLPSETVWIVQWHSTTDFDKPAEEVLRVLLNEEHAKKLLRLPATEPLPAIIWTSLAVAVYLEIAIVVLTSEPSEPVNKNGLLAKLVKRLRAETGLSQDALIAKANAGDEGIRFFRAHLQKSFALNERLLAISLQGRVR